MPVEFYCPHCEAFLRTPDSKKGKRARCPHCGDDIDVPFVSEVFIDEDDFDENLEFQPLEDRRTIRSELPSEARKTSEASPWIEDDVDSEELDFEPDATDGFITCAVCKTICPIDSELCYECGHVLAEEAKPNDQVDIGDIFRSSWGIFTQNFAVCALAGVLDVVLFIASLVVVLVPASLVGVAFRGHPIAIPMIFALLILGLTLATCALWVGHTHYFMAMVRGDVQSPLNVVHVGKFVGRMTTATILFFTLMICGLMMCGLPALLVITLFWPYGRYLLEHDCTAFEAMRGAFELTTNNFAASIAIVVILVLVTVIGNAVPFGIFLTAPFVGIFLSVAYLRFVGESVGIS